MATEVYGIGFALNSHLYSFVWVHLQTYLVNGAAHGVAARCVHQGRSPKDKIMLSLLKAQKIVDQAIRRARELGINISVAVCDDTGRLIALNQMDRSRGWKSDRCSMAKAVAAAVSGLPSVRFIEHVQRRASRSISFNNVVPPRGQRGGLPVVQSGVVEGGCGVSGAATAEQDEECARAGIAAIDETAESPLVPMRTDLLIENGGNPKDIRSNIGTSIDPVARGSEGGPRSVPQFEAA